MLLLKTVNEDIAAIRYWKSRESHWLTVVCDLLGVHKYGSYAAGLKLNEAVATARSHIAGDPLWELEFTPKRLAMAERVKILEDLVKEHLGVTWLH